MDVQDMSKEQLIDLADESGRNLENGKSQITSLEADQRKLVSLLLRLTKITGSLRNRLFELSMDNKALTESLEKRAPDVHALFSDLRSNSKRSSLIDRFSKRSRVRGINRSHSRTDSLDPGILLRSRTLAQNTCKKQPIYRRVNPLTQNGGAASLGRLCRNQTQSRNYRTLTAGANFVGPGQVHDFLVRRNGVSDRASSAYEHNEKKCHYADRKQAPTSRTGLINGFGKGAGFSRAVQDR
jgi:hypothetical protein